MSNSELVDFSNLMTVYNFEIDMLPDNLKCPKCSLVLKDACQVTCGCTFCRVCINDMIVNGCEFCPGISVDCGGALLSHFLTDNDINKSISRLNVKCPHNACFYKCELANMEEHIQICQKRIVDCPFHELGCKQEKMTAEKMTEHIQVENNSHSEILIGIIGIINNEIKDNKQEITTLKQSDENNRREIAMLKRELLMKDEQVKSMIDKIYNSECENKSIKEENADLANQVLDLSDKSELEIYERRENKRIDLISRITGSYQRKLETEIKSVQDDIRSIEQIIQSLRDDILQIKSKQAGMPANQNIIMTESPSQNLLTRRNMLFDPLMVAAMNAIPISRPQYNIVANGRATTIYPMYQYPMHGGSGPDPRVGAIHIKMTDPISKVNLSTTSKIANADSMEAKQVLGEKIYPLVSKHAGDMAGKITGMFLELDNEELRYMIKNENSLRMKIEEALLVLNAYKSEKEQLAAKWEWAGLYE